MDNWGQIWAVCRKNQDYDRLDYDIPVFEIFKAQSYKIIDKNAFLGELELKFQGQAFSTTVRDCFTSIWLIPAYYQ